MNFDRVKVKVHAHEEHCIVHLKYGDSKDEAMEQKILASLKQAGIYTDYVAPYFGVTDNPETVQSYLDLNKSLCYRIADGLESDEHSISIITATKDLAKGALAQLKRDHMPMTPSLNASKLDLDLQFEKLQKKGK